MKENKLSIKIPADLCETMTCKNCKFYDNGCTLNHNQSINGLNNKPVEPDSSCIDWEKKDNADLSKEQIELRKAYDRIIYVLKHYSELREDYYDLVAVWIVGTYIYEKFNTYPYLFINAMRGSGKTRLLKLIKAMARNGDLVTSLREAVLFRTAKGKTLCIDEFESIHKKENTGLRELLNACYKKGIKVQRMRKKKTAEGEEHVVEEFEPYTPICMANIHGMEEVLGDRCITMILEKSRTERVNRLIENFDEILDINLVKTEIPAILVQLCSYINVERYMRDWNLYVNRLSNYIYTLTTLTTQTAQTTLKMEDDEIYFKQIWNTGINGRNLELMFPLLIIGKLIGKDISDKMLKICHDLTKERKEEEMIESRDVSLIDYISKLKNFEDFYSIKSLTYEFREYLGDDDQEDRWLNDKWVGKSLKRLNLILDKHRVSKGIEVRINISKAKEMMEHFLKK